MAIDSLEECKAILERIKKENSEDSLIYHAFNLALIRYGAPFTRSEGNFGDYSIDSALYTPSQYEELHDSLIEKRHKVIAHFDLTKLKPKFSELNVGGLKGVLVSRDYSLEAELIERIDDILELVDVVLERLEQRYKEEEKELFQPSA